MYLYIFMVLMSPAYIDSMINGFRVRMQGYEYQEGGKFTQRIFVICFLKKNQYTDDVINNVIGIRIGSFYFNKNLINTLIEKLNICKATGPDGTHAKIIKECSCIFPHILNTIVHVSLMERKNTPTIEEANVIALYKKGSKYMCSNYKPVSVTSIVCKLLESLI